MVKSRIPHMQGESWGPFVALGVVRRGTLLGGFIYNEYRKHDIQLSAAFDRPGWALPGTLRALFSYPFNELGVARISAVTSIKNKKARKALVDIGFSLEGKHPKAISGLEDAVSYGMLRSDCKWIR
jgi:hypothetical protein